MDINQALIWGQDVLHQSGIREAMLDAQILLGHCLNMGRTHLLIRADQVLTDDVARKYTNAIERRKGREPVAYIIGHWEFWSFDIEVTPDVLIPRPETEYLVEKVVQNWHDHPVPQAFFPVVDLCCGSGAIALALAKELNQKVIAIDISEKALEITRKNTIKHGLDDAVFPLCCDLLSGLTPQSAIPLIVSNPPYVSKHEIENELEPDVASFEPRLALDGGEAGLDVIERIASSVLGYLTPRGYFFMEFGAYQGKWVREIFCKTRTRNRCFVDIEIIQDYNGRDRILQCRAD